MYLINHQTLLAVTMYKILLLAVLANICFLVSSTESNSYSRNTSSSSSSSSSQSSSSSSYSSSDCTEDDEDSGVRCKEDEEYIDCPSRYCAAVNCSQIGYPLPSCISDGTNSKCPDKKGICICKGDNKRNDEGICIPTKECPSCGGDENAVSGCGMYCQKRCSNYKEPIVACPAICMLSGCECRENYVYDDNIKKCVLPCDCTPTCGKDEVYSDCTNGGCQAKNCSQIGKPIPCVKIDPKYCIKGCLCKEGYLRALNGTCVPKDKCEAPTCGINEVYSNCSNQICSMQNCSEVGRIIRLCPKIDESRCKGGCICQEGYLRNTSGICVPRKDCDICHDDINSVPGCGINCGRLCSNYDKGPVACPKICNTNACDCKAGFVMDTNTGKCVLPKNCTPTCGTNEIYSGCVNGLCRAINCSQKGKPIACPSIVKGACKGACICKQKYLRENNGTCVPEDQCGVVPPQKCKGKNEEWDKCPQTCNPQTCQSIGKTYNCPAILNGNNCQPSCRCKPGFYRNKNNECISEKDCSLTCGKNEVYSDCINGGCHAKNCSQIGKPIPCVRIDPKYCVKGCLCKEGYLRSRNGNCVPKDKCDEAPKCGINEVYSNCSNQICSMQNCSEVGGIIRFCPKIDESRCKGGCICQEGYLRNTSGICVPRKDCDICHDDINSVPGCGINCGRLCSNYDKGPVACPKICKTNACDCKPGYVMDTNIGKCVLPKKCTPTCGTNEIYSGCVNGLCRAVNCSQKGKPIACPLLIKGACRGGCICKDKYLKENNGTCVPEDQCGVVPPRCGQNEVFNECPILCPPKRCDVDITLILCQVPPKPGDPNCKPGCECIDGYLRDQNGLCIPKDKCHCSFKYTVNCTGPHEYYDCNVACDNVCATIHIQNKTNCPIINKRCNEMCYCEDGYARNEDNICVPISQCKSQKCTGKNEEWNKCPPTCPPQTCESIGKTYKCPAILKGKNCQPSCRCKPGFYRNKNNECISEKDCLKCTGPHEYFSCGGACDNVCATLNKQNQTNCPIVNIKCNEMCYCETGYARNDNGTCIPIKDCKPLKCGKNEVYSDCTNGGCQAKNCSQIGKPIPCVKIDPKYCIKGCLCKEGYLRSQNGNCVPKDKCDEAQKCTGKNEEWNKCPPTCPPQTCESIGKTYKCPAILKGKKCQPSCRCKPGFYRNKINQCISKKDCLKCKGPNEYFSCGGACDNVCATLNKQNQTNCPIRNVKCNERCYCEKNYARNDNGTCIPIKECNRPKCNKPHEVWNPCPRNCPPETCESIRKRYRCPIRSIPLKCRGSCRCEKGFYRNKIGECVSKKNCLKCTGPHEYFSCGGACDNVCATLNKQNQTNCPIVNIKCNEMCYCETGYARNDNGTCIPIKDCKPLKCGKNEVYSDCTNGGCQAKNCSQIGKPIPCVKIDPKYCIKGCLCKEGYLRSRNGNCVPKDKCDEAQKCTGKNEEWNKCPPTCPPQTCESIGKTYKCPAILKGKKCQPSCRCKPGFYRNKINQCISKKDCLKCKGPNEYFSCGGACDNVCATLNKQNQTNCPIRNVKCNERCYCEKNYARNDNGTCIPIKECNRPKCNKPHEVWNPCPRNCPPETCESIRKRYRCPIRSIPLKCRGSCRCEKGFYRNKIGECVSKKNCLKCTGPHEYFSCGGACDNVCATLNKQNQTNCPIVNIKCNEMCYCETDYARNDNGTCIPIKNCKPLKCGKNEVYSDCTNGGCQAKNCSQIGKPIPCVKIDPKYCIKGCLCKEGYLRSRNGNCVPKDKCDEAQKCTGKNEEWNKCPPTCPPQTCESIGKTYKCPAILKGKKCQPSCRCKPGFYRNKNNECISEKDCLKCKGPNEYFSCGGACDNVCATLNKQNQTNCPIRNVKCNERCYCEKNYARNDNGTCIPIKECNRPKCNKPHEVWNPCPRNCPPETCGSIGKRYSCLIPSFLIKCRGSCRCEKGFYRNKIGECISKKNCLKCTGPHEYFSCGGACDNVCATLDKQNQTNCPIVNVKCNEMCYCEKGYARNDNGTCIPIKDCKPKCPKQNEVWDDCPAPCPPRRCDVDDRVIRCAAPPKPGSPQCKPSCRCANGFVRNDKGLCVTRDQCTPKCKRPHEVWNPCPTNCPPQTCETIGKVYHCPPQKICKGSCRCEKEFYLNKIGECISKKNCLKCTGPHEYFSCGGACDNVCATLDKQNQTNCPIVNVKCNEMCYCEKGYARNDNGTCIPIKDCKPLKCGKNEVYSDCTNGGCQAKNCSQIGKPIPCVKIDPKYCIKGCLCKEGYLRSRNGNCVPKDKCDEAPPQCPEGEIYNKCPPVKCDAEYCPQSRDDPLSCPIGIVCDKPRCTCGFNSHRDRITNKCIPTRDCPPFECDGQNEKYDSCPPVCPGQTCNDYLNNATCPKYRIGIVVPCKPQCRCTKGNWRNSEGVCVCGKECAKCPNQNEVWDECPAPCPPRRCGVDLRVIKCGAAPPKPGSPQCNPSCRCAFGFLRNDKEVCVPRDQCKKETNTTSPPVNSTDARQRFKNGNLKFTGKCFQEVVEANSGSSVVMSPFSVLFPLAQLALYSNGSSHEELMKILSLNSKDEIRDVIPKIIKMYEEQQSVQFNLAAKVYVNKKYELSDAFKQDTKNVFDSEAENIDVSDPQKAAAIINAWVEAQTNHLITDLVSPQMINALTRLVLTNAIYFKGNWVKQFNPKDTSERNFTLPNNDVKKIKMMYQKGRFRYAESKELDAKILELPYKGKNFTFVAILPNKVDGVNALVKKLVDPEVFKRALSSLASSTVIIHLPLVETSLQIDLTTILKKLGVTKCFIPGESGLTGILKKLVDLYVSVFIQKAKIIINETGTEAAAANVAVISATSATLTPPKVNIFDANHGFAYFLNLEEQPMFIGTYTGKP